jgi:hypothetical protein
MVKKQYGSPELRVRVPRQLLRRYKQVAKIYGATLPVFVRDCLTAMVDADTKLAPFVKRLGEGMARVHAEQQQRELNLAVSPSKK